MPRFLVTGTVTTTIELETDCNDPRDAVQAFAAAHPDVSPAFVETTLRIEGPSEEYPNGTGCWQVVGQCEACGRGLIAGDPWSWVETEHGQPMIYCGPCAEPFTQEASHA